MASIIHPFSLSKKAAVCFSVFRSVVQEGHPTDYIWGITLYLQQSDPHFVIKSQLKSSICTVLGSALHFARATQG